MAGAIIRHDSNASMCDYQVNEDHKAGYVSGNLDRYFAKIYPTGLNQRADLPENPPPSVHAPYCTSVTLPFTKVTFKSLYT